MQKMSGPKTWADPVHESELNVNNEKLKKYAESWENYRNEVQNIIFYLGSLIILAD